MNDFVEALRQLSVRRTSLRTPLFLALVLTASHAFAQDSESGDAAPPAATTTATTATTAGKKPPKRTTINFEDQLIEGRTQKPELFVLLQNRMNNSRRLFKLRENFLPEMRKTGEDITRSDAAARGKTESSR